MTGTAGGDGLYRTVVVGTDGSITASRAVQRAVRVAVVCGARLIVAYVGDRSLGRDVLDAVVAQHGDAGPEIDPRLLTGDPAEALLGLAAAEHADLVVVGSRGLTGPQRFLLGSVPGKVTHRADRDVLVVHTTGR